MKSPLYFWKIIIFTIVLSIESKTISYKNSNQHGIVQRYRYIGTGLAVTKNFSIMKKQLTESEIKTMLKSAFWDRKVDIELLYTCLIDKDNIDYPIDTIYLYSRLLLSIKWYALLKIVPQEKWPELFSNSTIERLFPKSIQNRFFYARSILL